MNRCIVRTDRDGKPEEVVVDCDVVYIQRLEDDMFWIGICRGDERMTFVIASEGKVNISLHTDELNAVDDTKR